ncbi:hypothetical protein Bequi_01825 [Brachybacterium sp. JHP9]|uniref:Uncharacterized protein n=1 Tax=Brachybacterium equifaecis TaxID=2910770 RepID=A0ABT0QZJ6_9MICO|nr:hypothetical protein [Brachybacterium equifaecis]MCL6422140.1 hypothetical protein [Brachybacterium equifaecis]
MGLVSILFIVFAVLLALGVLALTVLTARRDAEPVEAPLRGTSRTDRSA